MKKDIQKKDFGYIMAMGLIIGGTIGMLLGIIVDSIGIPLGVGCGIGLGFFVSLIYIIINNSKKQSAEYEQ